MTWPGGDDLVPSRTPSVTFSPPVADDRSTTGVSIVVAAMVVALVVAVATIGRGAKSFWPTQWDPRLAPIAARAQQLRGLDFLHPVPVRFLSESEFQALVAKESAGTSAADRADIDRKAATFRALGFIGGDVDLFKAATAAAAASVLAFYDPSRKEMVVRGTTLDVAHRATLAEELTHALQDQHFDLSAIQSRASNDDGTSGGSSGAVTAIIEGDANRVEDRYVEGLSASERAEYGREKTDRRSQAQAAASGVPPFVELLLGAPYEFGPPAVRVLVASGGENAVNAALTGPTPTSAFMSEAGLLDPAPPMPAPAVLPGEKADGTPESFGAFETYLTLAMRVAPETALTAADTVVGGRARGVLRGGMFCYRATVQTRDAGGAAYLARLERQWAASATRGSVEQAGTAVTLTACDPGRSAVAPAASRVQQADALLVIRSTLTAQVAESRSGADNARCVARLITARPGILKVLEESTAQLTPATQAELRSLGATAALRCRSDTNAGIP